MDDTYEDLYKRCIVKFLDYIIKKKYLPNL